MKRQKGFTLIEMMVGIGVMLIVSAIATPVASTIFNQYEFTSTIEQLAYEVARTRMQAVAQNVSMRVRITSTVYVRERSTDNVTWVQVDEPVALPDGITAAAGSAGSPSFNRNGLAAASTEITVTRGSKHRTVHVSMIGRVTVT